VIDYSFDRHKRVLGVPGFLASILSRSENGCLLFTPPFHINTTSPFATLDSEILGSLPPTVLGHATLRSSIQCLPGP
jgi:hypothetical protein